MKKLLLCISTVFFLMGCGGRAPIKRAKEVLFDVPYIQKKQTHDMVEIGVKKLSAPEIKELFCKSGQLLSMYYVYYVRTHNTGSESYFIHLSGQVLPTRKDVSIFFDPYTTMHTIAHMLFVAPAAIGLAMLAPDALTYFAGFLGLNVGLHLAETQALGISGYQEFEKHVISGNVEHRMTSIVAIPFSHDHHIIFVPKRDPQSACLTFTVSARNKVTKDLVFDFSE
ncbi:MAG: hypothetical protein QG604_391 [Candidatus Dependentiae bacterium]|nr:hypothetical protein [Candidatus Dependentiae bacterium]